MRPVSVLALCALCVAAGVAAGRLLSPSPRTPRGPGGGAADAGKAAMPPPSRSVPAGNGAPAAVSASPAGDPAAARCPPPSRCPSPAPRSACPACAACPPAADLCAADRDRAGVLGRRLSEAEARLAEAAARRPEAGPRGRYDDPTVQGRRRLAAEDDHLLLELPSWGDDFGLSDEVTRKYGIDAASRTVLETACQAFNQSLQARLRELLAELTGDPDAGETATLNSLIHDILGLSPRPLCRERMLAVTAALASGAPLPPAAPDAPACEVLVLALFDAVDRLDAEVRGTLGEAAAGALWSGTSSFEFSTEGGDPPVPPE